MGISFPNCCVELVSNRKQFVMLSTSLMAKLSAIQINMADFSSIYVSGNMVTCLRLLILGEAGMPI